MDAVEAARQSSRMRRIVVPGALLAALAAAVATGCGGERAETAVPAEPGPAPVIRAPLQTPRTAAPAPVLDAPVVPVGFRLRRVPDAGTQVAVPRGWIALTRLDSLFPGTRQTLGGIDRRIVGHLAALGVPDSPLKLLVLGPVRKDGFAATVTLVVASSGSVSTFEGWSRRATAELLARTTPSGPVSSRRVTLPVGRGVRLRFHRLVGGRRLATVSYLALGGDKVYYLALTANRHERVLTRDFDRLARSLSLLPGATPVARVAPPARTV
jgi:hypothetical protein